MSRRQRGESDAKRGAFQRKIDAGEARQKSRWDWNLKSRVQRPEEEGEKKKATGDLLTFTEGRCEKRGTV